jgi:hypothetical protein
MAVGGDGVRIVGAAGVIVELVGQST